MANEELLRLGRRIVGLVGVLFLCFCFFVVREGG